MSDSPDPVYHKIVGFKGSFFSRSAVFASDDHLLLVTNTHFAEEYRRFYFNEIEGVTALRNRRGRYITIALSCLLLLLLVIAALSRDEAVIYTMVFIGALPLVLLIANLLLGQTVVCTIRTTASQHSLPMLSRLRRYKKFVERVRPYVEQSQGGRIDQTHLVARFGSRDPNQPLI